MDHLLLPIVIIVLALLLLFVTGRRRRALGVPEGEIVYQDATSERGRLLTSKRHRLRGRPDVLIRQQGTIIPVEAKTGRTPRQPYPGHVMQLMAYCVLVEEHYGVRPPYGIVRYPERQFEIAFTPQQETALLSILADIRQQRRVGEAHRSHDNPRVCASCGYRDQCDERLW